MDEPKTIVWESILPERKPVLSVLYEKSGSSNTCFVSEFRTDTCWKYLFQDKDLSVKNLKNFIQVDRKLTQDELFEYYDDWLKVNKEVLENKETSPKILSNLDKA